MHIRRSRLAIMIMAGAFLACTLHAAPNPADSKRLRIVFMLGDSEMVGNGSVSSLAYTMQKPMLPPREVTINAHKAMLHQPNGAYLYWQAMNSYGGPVAKRQELKRLIQDRADFKARFKQHVIDELEKNDGMFRDTKYNKRRGAYRGFWLFNLCDEECEKEGYTPKIRAILEAPDNKFNVEAAYDQLVADAESRYRKQLDLNKIYLKSATAEAFAAFAEAVRSRKEAPGDITANAMRDIVVGFAEKHLGVPVSERTYIVALGNVAGEAEGDSGSAAQGKLSIGYGADIDMIGMEYAAGLALEREIDGPILIVKCAWHSRRSIRDGWCMEPSEGSALSSDQEEQGVAWQNARAQIEKVLADPGKFHPDYDPEAGFEPAGMIWFQGSYDKGNAEYGDQLLWLLNEIREAVDRPSLPVLCATVGSMYFQRESDDHSVNQAMKAIASRPAFKDTVEVMDTYGFRASEIAAIRAMIKKRKIKPDSAMQAALATAGSGSFYLLAGHEAGSRLAAMIKD